jgi:hypothetical protein
MTGLHVQLGKQETPGKATGLNAWGEPRPALATRASRCGWIRVARGAPRAVAKSSSTLPRHGRRGPIHREFIAVWSHGRQTVGDETGEAAGARRRTRGGTGTAWSTGRRHR